MRVQLYLGILSYQEWLGNNRDINKLLNNFSKKLHAKTLEPKVSNKGLNFSYVQYYFTWNTPFPLDNTACIYISSNIKNEFMQIRYWVRNYRTEIGHRDTIAFLSSFNKFSLRACHVTSQECLHPPTVLPTPIHLQFGKLTKMS